MTVVSVVAKGREISPGRLDRARVLQVRDEQVQELSNIPGQLGQAALCFSFDLDLVDHLVII